MTGQQPPLRPSAADAHLHARLQAIETDQLETRRILRSVDESLKSLVRLEAHHAETREGMNRAFKSIKVLDLYAKETDKAVAAHARRLKVAEDGVAANAAAIAMIQGELPKLRQSSAWVYKAVLACAILVGGAFGGAVVERARAWFAPAPPQPPPIEETATTAR